MPVNAKPDGTVKLHAFVPSPTTALESDPETVHAPAIVRDTAFRILNTWFAEVKLAGAVPLPSVLVPQVDSASRLPDAFE